jgi:hypothetical protein
MTGRAGKVKDGNVGGEERRKKEGGRRKEDGGRRKKVEGGRQRDSVYRIIHASCGRLSTAASTGSLFRRGLDSWNNSSSPLGTR